jgi:magnesium transporter
MPTGGKIKKLHSWTLFLPEIKNLIQNKDFATLKNVLKEIHPTDLAEGWSSLSPEEKIIVFNLLSLQRAIEVFEDLEYKEQIYVLEHLDEASIKNILSDMPSDETLKLFKKMPNKIIKKLYSLMQKEEVEKIAHTMEYPTGSAGALMNVYFISLSPNMTAKQALEKIQISAKSHRTQNFHAFYVTDEENHLLGGVTLRRLISSPQDIRIKDIMSPVELIKINVLSPAEEVAKIFTKYDLVIAPVVDDENYLLGVISVDDVVDIIHKESGKQVYGLGKIGYVGKTIEINYAKASIFTLVKSRVVWLIVLLLIEVFISAPLLQRYTSILEAVIYLTLFIPLLMDTGGNAGQQSLTMIVRGLATGEVSMSARDLFRSLLKEFKTGVCMGTVTGLVGAVGAMLLVPQANIQLGLTVGLSLLCVITVSSCAGALLPFIFRIFGSDPAVSASPFITTVVDGTAILIYFEIAKRFILR